MRTLSVFSVAALTVAMSTVALAHVSIGPTQSQANATQTYTIRVPAEGTVPTTMLGLLLFGVQPWDPAVFAAVVLAPATAGTLASFIPARRATRVETVEAMRLD